MFDTVRIFIPRIMVDNISNMFLSNLNQDLESVAMLLQTNEHITDSMEFSEYFANLQRSRQHFPCGSSGEITPISTGSEIDVCTNEATAGSTADFDMTVTEDIDSSLDNELDNVFESIASSGNETSTTPKVCSPCRSESKSYISGHSTRSFVNPSKSTDMGMKNREISLGSDKWWASKEQFLEIQNEVPKELFCKIAKNPGTIVIKENYIDPPRIARVSRSFHGKLSASDSLLNIASVPRRASDGPQTSRTANEVDNKDITLPMNIRQLKPQLSHPGSSKSPSITTDIKKTVSANEVRKSRFTTTVVNEGLHAASMGSSINLQQINSVLGLNVSSANINQLLDTKDDSKSNSS